MFQTSVFDVCNNLGHLEIGLEITTVLIRDREKQLVFFCYLYLLEIQSLDECNVRLHCVRHLESHMAEQLHRLYVAELRLHQSARVWPRANVLVCDSSFWATEL